MEVTKKLLTPDEHSNRYPFVTPDGKSILFESWRKSDRGQTCALWRMNVEGTNPEMLAGTECYVGATCGDDCSSILFDRYISGTGIWKVPIAGGDPVQVIKDETYKPDVSPDGTKIACFRVNAAESEIPSIAIYSAEGGSPVKIFQPVPQPDIGALRWTPDGTAIVYVSTQEGVSNLWLQPLNESATVQITKFDSDQILSFDSSNDGHIAVARGKNQNDVMMITTESP